MRRSVTEGEVDKVSRTHAALHLQLCVNFTSSVTIGGGDECPCTLMYSSTPSLLLIMALFLLSKEKAQSFHLLLLLGVIEHRLCGERDGMHR